jgi:phosphoglucosamine mutase
VQFGTDGIRGRAGSQITDALAYRLGRAVAAVFAGQPCFVGYDTRESSPSLASAALSGLVDGGAEAVNLGVITTPGVAVVAEQRRGVGLVVSASHNAYLDNGLKVLGPGGSKLDFETEHAVQVELDAAVAKDGPFEPTRTDASGAVEYLERLRAVLAPDALEGLHVVLDCANGAASQLAPSLFRSLGADVSVIHADPDGTNINRGCGSTDPRDLAAAVRASRADLGLAFDGDADRLIAVDAHGVVRDGDDLIVLFAQDLNERHELGGAVVVTQMSNLGLRRAMHDARVAVIETEVGDRAVLLALEEAGLPFGGEQSGHLIFRNLSPSGDGMLTGLLLADLVQRRGRLSQLAEAAWRRVPQRLLNVPAERFAQAVVDEVLADALVRFGLGAEDFRLLVRPSGTEPVVRVMIEALDQRFVDEFIARVAERCAVAP